VKPADGAPPGRYRSEQRLGLAGPEADGKAFCGEAARSPSLNGLWIVRVWSCMVSRAMSYSAGRKPSLGRSMTTYRMFRNVCRRGVQPLWSRV